MNEQVEMAFQTLIPERGRVGRFTWFPSSMAGTPTVIVQEDTTDDPDIDRRPAVLCAIFFGDRAPIRAQMFIATEGA